MPNSKSFKSLVFITFTFAIFLQTINAAPIVVMSYNVENFFDAEDDPKVADEAYLPTKHPGKKKCQEVKNPYYRKSCFNTNWTEEKVERKIQQHMKVLEAFPEKLDFLGLIEIENEKIGKLFQSRGSLKGLVMSTGNDHRGINVALLYNDQRFRLVAKREHPLSFKTRNILEVELQEKKGNKVFHVFVNHWPSQRSKTPKRLEAASVLEKRLNELKKNGPKAAILVMGDFNTLEKERPHPFDPVLKTLKDSADSSSGVASYFYKRTMSWNLLDRIFYSANLKIEKFDSFKPSFSQEVVEYTKKKSPFWGSRIVGAPKGYDHNKVKKPGYSDHFPVWAKLSTID